MIKKASELQKNIYFCPIDYAKAFYSVDHNKLWKILQEMGLPDHPPASWEICMQVKKQQLKLDMEQQTGSKSRKEYVKAIYCHPAYLTYIHFITLSQWRLKSGGKWGRINLQDFLGFLLTLEGT